MLISLFDTFRRNRPDALHHESDRPESLLVIACDGSSEDCYDDPGGEIPPLNPNPDGGRLPAPETQGKGGDTSQEPTLTARIALALSAALAASWSPAPAAV
jgi:hypothetical protein